MAVPTAALEQILSSVVWRCCWSRSSDLRTIVEGRVPAYLTMPLIASSASPNWREKIEVQPGVAPQCYPQMREHQIRPICRCAEPEVMGQWPKLICSSPEGDRCPTQHDIEVQRVGHGMCSNTRIDARSSLRSTEAPIRCRDMRSLLLQCRSCGYALSASYHIAIANGLPWRCSET